MKKLILTGIILYSFSNSFANQEKPKFFQFFEETPPEYLGGRCCLFGEKISLASYLNQQVPSMGAVLFEQVILESQNFDILESANKGEARFKKRGVYKISWATENKPLQTGLLAYGIFLDGQMISETIACEFVQADQPRQISGASLFFVSPGQVLKLVNISEKEAHLISSPRGNPSANLSIDLLVEL